MLVPREPGLPPGRPANRPVRREIEAYGAAARDLPLLLPLALGAADEPDAVALAAWASALRRCAAPRTGLLIEDAGPTGGTLLRRARADLRDAGATGPAVTLGYRIATPRSALTADQAAEWTDLLVLDVPALTRACGGTAAEETRGPAPLDVAGVGQLLELAVQKALAARHDLVVLAQGIDPGDAAGLRCCARIGVSGVTTPAERLPAMRIAAAQAALRR